MQWACVLLPQLAMDGVLRRRDVAVHGAAEDAAIALVEGPMQRRTLHSVTPAARALGLKPGLPLAAAQALSTRFEAIPYDADDVERWRALLAAWAYRFSSQVSTEFPHALLLEVGHSLRLFGPWPRLEARLREELHALGFRHRIVAAPNPHAARVLANVHDGLAVDEHALRNALGQLPLERSGLPRQVAFSLSRMGVRKLRQVFALPRDAIARRFPKTVLEHLDAIRGELAAPLQCYQPPQHFEGRIEFDSEVESSQALLFPLRRPSQDLAAFLAGRDGGVQRYTLVLEHERCADSEVEVGLLTPQREANMLFELGRGRLEQARLPAPVRGFRLVARELPPFVPAARDLFETRAQQDVPWPQLRERLRARLGDDAVHGIGHSPEHRPERVSMTGKPSPDARPRPGWLLPHVLPLRDHALRVVAGPERIESGWWDGGDIRRDYYVVETSLGQRAWAFCAAGEPVEAGPAPSHFMLHGWFA